MNNQFSKIILTFSFVLLGSFFFSAQKAEADCVVNSANFRAFNSSGQVISQFPLTGWYTDAVKPYVYIDVETSGCNGQTIEFSLTESDAPATNAWLDDDVNGPDFTDIGLSLSGSFVPIFSCNTSLPSCLDNRPLPVGAAASESNFTIVLQTGEDECEVAGNPDCIYYVRFNDEPVPASAEEISQVPTLKYQCDGSCFEDWAFIAKINFMGVYSADPNNPENIDPDDAGPGSAGLDIDINIQNPIGPSDMTLVDFIEKVINFALTIGIPIIAIAIIYAGLLFVTAQGKDQQLETAKNAFTYAVIGGAILLGSWIFAKLIKDTIESIVMISSYFV